MSMVRFSSLILLLAAVATAQCSGSARYRVTVSNFLAFSNPRFASIVPDNQFGGLVYAPPVVVTHSPRFSLLTLRGFATPALEAVCETGNNTDILAETRASSMVNSVEEGSDIVSPGGNLTIEVTATCASPYLTMVAMVAPSPDWIVAISNMPLVGRGGKFIRRRAGRLRAYDCGTDSGVGFTNPDDPSLDIPTVPQQNIAPLVEDESDVFGRRTVGSYRVVRIS